jgi:class 3 adenylate cyclase/tetratricopeptide (TPR) repeat protein
MQTCPACGQENPAGFKFCGACGAALDAAPVAAREERKVISVLFADLVGFTSRAEKLDPEDVRALLSPYYARLRHELERHGGTVEKFIGDAVVALFGAPVAHEDDPERGVRAALAIRGAVAELNEADPTLELEVRIAVNTGEALIALGARPELGEGMASGDVVNTAARLQTAAPVNGILVGEATYRATTSAIEYATAEAVSAKGKSEPVPAWEALRARARFGLDVEQRPKTPLVGRERELGVLSHALGRAREETSPQLVTLVGVPGIGKSRLLAELFQVVDRDPDLILWRQGRSLPYGEALSYWALAEIVKSQLGVLENDSVDVADAKLRAGVAAAIDSAEAEWTERHLRPLLGLGAQPAEAGDRRAEAFAAWRRFLEAIAERQPIVLVFEDLHWADDGLLDFIDYLADWASGVALLIVCTARPELLAKRPEWGGGKRSATTVTVPALRSEETAQLLATLLEQTLLPAEIQAAVLRRTEGNPLFAEEYVRMLQDRGFLVRGRHGWALEDHDKLPLPETVQGMIAARLDSLSAEEKELVQSAAVIGKVFWTGAVAALGGAEKPYLLEERLHALERKEFLRRERRSAVAAETQYAFLHLLLRDVAYGQIPRAERAAKHVCAAEWMESLAADRSEDRAEMLAHHYIEALDLLRATGADETTVSRPARRALKEAAERALALHAPAAAIGYLDRALDVTSPDDPDRARLLFTYITTKWALGENQIELGETAYELALANGQRELAAETLSLLAHELWAEGLIELAAQRSDEAFALVSDAPPSRTTASVRAERAVRLWISGRVDEGLDLALETLVEAEAVGAEDVAAHALRVIGTIRAASGDEQGFVDLERSVEIGNKLSDPLTMHLAYNNMANMHWHFGRVAEGAKCLEIDREIQTRFGLAPGSVNLRWIEGEEILHLDLVGRWNEVVRRAEQFMSSLGEGRHYLVGACQLLLANALGALGDLPGALAASETALELAREVKDPQQLHPALLARGRVLFAVGRRPESSAVFDELMGAKPMLNEYWFKELPWALLEHERQDEYLTAAKVAAQTPWVEAGVAVASRDFAKAAAIYEDCGAQGIEAIARLHAAEKLASGGDAARAEEELTKARRFFEAEGAMPYLRRCEAVLAAAS